MEPERRVGIKEVYVKFASPVLLLLSSILIKICCFKPTIKRYGHFIKSQICSDEVLLEDIIVLSQTLTLFSFTSFPFYFSEAKLH